MRQMLRLLTLTGLISVLVACASGGAQTRTVPAASPPTPTPTPGIPAGTLLFQSDWSEGLNGWGNPPGWTVVQGAVQSDNRSNDTLTVPYTPSFPNYVLEVSFQVISVPANGGQFIIQALPAKNRDGYQASVLNLLSSAPHSEFAHPQFQIYTHSLNGEDGSFYPSVYLPGKVPHTFRLAVQGPEVDLSADGTGKGSAISQQTSQLSSGPLQVIVSGVIMRISSVRITAL